MDAHLEGPGLKWEFASLRSDLAAELKSTSRRRRSACVDGSGNLGFNSFNFMAFIVLVFNAVANINNNLNNNNNNINDNNLNAISQESNNVASTVNVANQVGITILPIPGRRRRRSVDFWLRKRLKVGHREDSLDALGSYLVKELSRLHVYAANAKCEAFQMCKTMRRVTRRVGVDAIFKNADGLKVSQANCNDLFPGC